VSILSISAQCIECYITRAYNRSQASPF